MVKYLSLDGLSYFWGKIKTWVTSQIPTKTSDITNDSGFITKAVNDLTNYYLKTETYTQTEINNLIGQIDHFKWLIVTELPESGQKTNVIYLLGPTGSGADKYEEYVWNKPSTGAGSWVKIGDTSIDLSGYATKVSGATSGNFAGLDAFGNLVDSGKDASSFSKVTASAANGDITVDGTDITVYTHPTTTAVAAAAVKVGKDGDGHVVLGSALDKSDVGLGNVDNTSDATKKTNFTGSIASGNTGFVTGGDVYSELADKVDKTTTVNGHALSGNVTVTKSDLSLDNVTNDAQVKRTEMGVANGVATLDSNGLVPISQLPDSLDEILWAYPVEGATELSSGWLKANGSQTAYTPNTDKVYILAQDTTNYKTNSLFRWNSTVSTYEIMYDSNVVAITTSEIDTICAS